MNESEFCAEFYWPLAQDISTTNESEDLFKEDKFIELIEELRPKSLAWAPVHGSTRRTEKETKLRKWITDQNVKLNQLLEITQGHSEGLEIDSFPIFDANPQKRTITISKNIVYLIDTTSDFLDCIQKSFGDEIERKVSTILSVELPVFLYLTASITSNGRAFKGDPFTGQVAAYSQIFSRSLLNERERHTVCYYPHQLWSQFFDKHLKKSDSKGTAILESVSDLIISSNGVPINPKRWCLI